MRLSLRIVAYLVELCYKYVPYPGDSGQTPARSICLKFAGPTIRTKRQLVRSFLESRIQRTSTRKSKLKAFILEFVLYIDCLVFSCI